MQWFLVAGVALWFVFGDPPRTVAGWLYPDDAAPWETVDAYFYPSNQDLSSVKSSNGLESVQMCRDWVALESQKIGDPSQLRSDYECGVGTPIDMHGMKVYRATVD